jgi:hypothetical protein
MTHDTLPGFTADHSIGEHRRGYRTAGNARRGFAGISVAFAPQALRPLLRGDKRGCDPTCLCITPEGCPCCQSIPYPIRGRVRR